MGLWGGWRRPRESRRRGPPPDCLSLTGERAALAAAGSGLADPRCWSSEAGGRERSAQHSRKDHCPTSFSPGLWGTLVGAWWVAGLADRWASSPASLAAR